MSNSMRNETKFAQYIAQALNDYLQNTPHAKIEGDEIYKFSMKLWFDIAEQKIKALNINDVKFVTLNKTLNKKYRKEIK